MEPFFRRLETTMLKLRCVRSKSLDSSAVRGTSVPVRYLMVSPSLIRLLAVIAASYDVMVYRFVAETSNGQSV